MRPAVATCILLWAELAATAPAAPVPDAAKKPVWYYAVKKGTKWVYRSQNAKDITILLDAAETKDGATTISLVELSEDGKKTPSEKVSLSAAGVFRVEVHGEAIQPPLCLLKLPVKAGDRWEDKARDTRFDLRARFTASGPSMVSVPAGQFEAVGITKEMVGEGGVRTSPPDTDWYAPGVGLVKTTQGDAVMTTLLSFTPGK